MAKEGFTKSGKSLKAVRRYYAIQNAQKQDAERARSPEDGNLSKRIAVELRTQQEANTKRLQSPTGAPADMATAVVEQPALPEGVVVSPKQTGPVFMTREAVAATGVMKSLKSIKSSKGIAPILRLETTRRETNGFSKIDAYFIGAMLVETMIFILTHIYIAITKDTRWKSGQVTEQNNLWRHELAFQIKWMSYTCLVAAIACFLWIFRRGQFILGVLSLITLSLSGISTAILMASSRTYNVYLTGTKRLGVFDVDDPIVFVSIIIFLILQLLMITLMILNNIVFSPLGTSERSASGTGGFSNILTPINQG